MFWDNFVELCIKKGQSPNSVCDALGYSTAVATKWKRGSIPRDTTIRKIADYFEVSVDYLISDEKEKPTNNGELSVKKKQIIERIKLMPDEKLVRVEQILDIVESTNQ